MKKVKLFFIGIAAVLAAFSLVYISNRQTPRSSTRATITQTFAACKSAGYKILESFPQQCISPDGKIYVEDIPTPTGGGSLDIDPKTREARNILVHAPMPHETVGRTFRIRGMARVFENMFAYRLKDTSGTILAQGTITAYSPEVGQFGAFDAEVVYLPSPVKSAVLQVFSTSPKDGTEINMIAVPLTLQ